MANRTNPPFDFLNENDMTLLGRVNYKRFCQLIEHKKKGTCAFCPGNGLDPAVNVIIYDEQGWVAWEVGEGLAPRSEGLSLHLMMSPKRHMASLEELTDAEEQGMLAVRRWAYNTYDLSGYFGIERGGKTALTASAKEHAGLEFKVPNGTTEVTEKFMKTPGQVHENEARRERFFALYNIGVTSDQFYKMVTEGTISVDARTLP